ncbi:GD16685 [Drosophila simulans]|uniref:GD16685 n=1 Tax=Drosophila simulans TaxID=7240 RepID=B4R4H3_DROSI|nr:GD16685 [Drosophila simulans]
MNTIAIRTFIPIATIMVRIVLCIYRVKAFVPPSTQFTSLELSQRFRNSDDIGPSNECQYSK